ncbi:MAG: hypothetical protein GF411_06035 [Candidatus Lokiarchaeota archaeon]|nr:hypothetical protein [Candidatus Lokiarchaeota archaeon]
MVLIVCLRFDIMFAICAFGDSIVFGRGDNLDRGWVGRLRKYFEIKDQYNALYNLGIPGNSTTELLDRLDTECKARLKQYHEGDRFVILIGIGINDSRFVGSLDKPQTEKGVFRKNILKIIETAKIYSNEIVFIGLTPVDEKLTNPYEDTFFLNSRIKEFNAVIQDCCSSTSEST